ncbi:response regulator [Noviherbaspirillum sp. Root189]|uniref:response regulator n=1 Tax=Noviherbaspirillum sp. Root189 TaxID=1736487 RepID=UPI00070C255B|nr:response regulator [Noviherbaspirillum sp. Root189]KRB66399.1 response regulator receiver protein [Noviherbaspirillum sp. Root189]
MARILIIEDSPANMKLAVLLLKSAGHSPLQAEDARKGIAMAQAEQPDLILMDMQLPDMDGMEATGVIKANPETAHIPIVALTASAMKGDRERILAAGCDGYIEKPIDFKTFLAEINTICDKQK